MTRDTIKPCSRCGGSGHEPDDRAIGEQMRAMRKRRGVSLRDAAWRLGFTASYLCDLELGRRRWSPTMQRRYREEVVP